MAEFLGTYGVWIVFLAFVLLMLMLMRSLSHAGDECCGPDHVPGNAHIPGERKDEERHVHSGGCCSQ